LLDFDWVKLLLFFLFFIKKIYEKKIDIEDKRIESDMERTYMYKWIPLK